MPQPLQHSSSTSSRTSGAAGRAHDEAVFFMTGRACKRYRNRSTGARNRPSQSPSFRPFSLFTPPEDQQDEKDSLAGGDNKLSSVYAQSRAHWRGLRLRRPRIFHSADGDRASAILPLRVAWDRNFQRGGPYNVSLRRQWRDVVVNLERDSSLVRLRPTRIWRLEQQLRRRSRRRIGPATSSLALLRNLRMPTDHRRRSFSGNRSHRLLLLDDD
ncbi:hypothetical protein BV898_00626 [Hypsibius exemplaris]|uniref:Uncharacterized protein n=1 Tax=Hypsibius exemplaris TaxID=2072580 RepID=A0A1W0XE19_HYPEX|nr:hypothetical protein BV898_00626 [Hypsibius exemplaris]